MSDLAGEISGPVLGEDRAVAQRLCHGDLDGEVAQDSVGERELPRELALFLEVDVEAVWGSRRCRRGKQQGQPRQRREAKKKARGASPRRVRMVRRTGTGQHGDLLRSMQEAVRLVARPGSCRSRVSACRTHVKTARPCTLRTAIQ